MPKYLIQASYSAEGLEGLLAEGGTSRRVAVEQFVQELGGKLEAYYFAFGENDVYAIVELPDNVKAATATITIASAGTAKLNTTVLITPEEMDQATKTSTTYRPPGR